MSSVAENETCIIPSGRVEILPSFADDGKGFAYSYFYEDDELNTMRFCIYDEDFQMVKEFTSIVANPDEYQYQTQERERIPVNATVYDEYKISEALSIDGISEGLSVENVLDELNKINPDAWEICNATDGQTVIAKNYYCEDDFGKKYPHQCYKQDKGLWYLYEISYNTVYAPYGEWKEPVISKGLDYPGIEYIEILQIDGADQEWVELTRGIFSDDFNYVIAVYEKEEFNEEYTYEATDWVYKKVCGYRSVIKGFKAYDSSNNTVASFELPEGYSSKGNLKFWRLGDKRYISVEAESSTEYVDIVYFVDKNNKVTQIAIAPSAKISPRTPRQGELVSITFNESTVSSPKTINVVSASGHNVYKTKLPAGQSSVDIDTSRLNQGMYVVTVNAEGRSQEAAKIIVR